MVIDLKLQDPPGTSLRSLVKGYLLIHQAGESSPNTVEYYRGSLRRFLPYGEQQAWSDDIRLLTSGICVSKAASACVSSSGTWSYVSKIPFEAIPIGDDLVQIDG